MLAPTYIQLELKATNPLYFAVYNGRPKIRYNEDGTHDIDNSGRWHIRKWKSVHPINHRIDTWRFNSVNILTLCKMADTGEDLGYEELNMKAVHSVREGLQNAINAKKFLQQIDKANDDLIAGSDAEEEYIHRYAAKRIWHYYKEPTIILG